MDLLGWSGSFFIILSYSLTLSKQRDFSKACKYLNLFGGALVALNCYYYSAMPSFITNAMWSGIAVLSLFRAQNVNRS